MPVGYRALVPARALDPAVGPLLEAPPRAVDDEGALAVALLPVHAEAVGLHARHARGAAVAKRVVGVDDVVARRAREDGRSPVAQPDGADRVDGHAVGRDGGGQRGDEGGQVETHFFLCAFLVRWSAFCWFLDTGTLGDSGAWEDTGTYYMGNIQVPEVLRSLAKKSSDMMKLTTARLEMQQ